MQKGFSLLELIFVVMVMAVLMSFALPAYQRTMARVQLTEGLSLASSLQTAVAEWYFSRGALPKEAESFGNSVLHGQYVEGIEYSRGQIVIRYGRSANHLLNKKTLRLTPYAEGEQLVWRCQDAAPLSEWRLLEGVEDYRLETDLPSELLPPNCR